MTDFESAPVDLATVLSSEWLSQMLGQCWPDAMVRGVEVVETLATQATKVRLKLLVEGGGAEVPTAICIKGVLTDTGAVPSASIVETLFYREAAALLPVRVPDCIHAGMSADNSRGVIVMRDVIAAGGTFCNALDAFTPAQVIDGLDQLARLHVASPAGSPAFGFGWAHNFLDRISKQPIIPQEALQALLDGQRGEKLNPAVRDAARLQRALESLAVEVRAGPLCLVHGDAHAGNVYREANGALGLVDWQILQKGNWAMDVAYHLAAVLTPEDRRTHERALLAEYYARLKALGGPDVGADEAWRSYRVAMVYGYYLWAITRKVESEIIDTFVYRLGTAADDLQSFELMGI
ncbi:MAG: aminoglycoside phosphotransferase family protein [Sphingorhabdus sp.]|nr:aminoglycoside phosphotransferase family protein [Sphingorhabdus sp.]